MQPIEVCAPYTLRSEELILSNANDVVVEESCGTFDCAQSLARDLGTSLNTINDPVTGCSSGIKVRN